MRSEICFAVLICLATVACSTANSPDADSAQASAPSAPSAPSAAAPARIPLKGDKSAPPREGLAMSEFSISMRRGACFGRCPQYSVTVKGDGSVDFVGERFVGATGAHSHRADMDKLALLRQKAQAVFRSTADVVPGAAGCRNYATDMPQVTLTLADADGTRGLRHYTGCADAPAALRELEQLIDATARVDEWVSGRALQ